MTTYELIAALLRADLDAKRYFPSHEYDKIHETLLAAANAITDAETLQVRISDVFEWSDQISEMCANVATNAQRARAGGE